MRSTLRQTKVLLTLLPTEHDFFQTQPLKDVSVFFMRHILHDWADSYCVKILRQLRDAASPTTRLFAMDKLAPYVCPPHLLSENEEMRLPGVLTPKLEAPLNNVISGNNYALGASVMVSQTQIF